MTTIINPAKNAAHRMGSILESSAERWALPESLIITLAATCTAATLTQNGIETSNAPQTMSAIETEEFMTFLLTRCQDCTASDHLLK
jgi:hypothetical protein